MLEWIVLMLLEIFFKMFSSNLLKIVVVVAAADVSRVKWRYLVFP